LRIVWLGNALFAMVARLGEDRRTRTPAPSAASRFASVQRSGMGYIACSSSYLLVLPVFVSAFQAFCGGVVCYGPNCGRIFGRIETVEI